MSSSNNRVYNNFPGTVNGFKGNFGPGSEWYEIGTDVNLSKTRGTGILFEPREFKAYIRRYERDRGRDARVGMLRNAPLYTTNAPNHPNNRGFQVYVGRRAKWFKWPTSEEQIEKFHFFFNSNNNSYNNSNFGPMIKWEKKFVKNMPTNEAGSLDNFKNGNKVIQYKVGKVNKYISPYTFQKLSKMSPIRAYYKPQTQILFKNPFTRANVKRGEIKFMVLKNAATKIQSVVRGKKARNVVQAAARRKLLANAAAKRK